MARATLHLRPATLVMSKQSSCHLLIGSKPAAQTILSVLLLERNRQAASKCRKRRKDWISKQDEKMKAEQ